ncbi:MAG TPA: thioredoxin domain-containing protein, partial [Pseudolysinimonas sp.]|nr:thioredoxin domain-containing protein [Pseudolysinimonas sp.]
LVLACLDGDGAPRVPGGGDPVLAAQGIATPDAASDGDEPSGPSALADAVVSLWRLGGPGELRAVAERIVVANAAGALEQPLAYGAMLRVAAELAQPPRQLVVVAEERSAPLVAAARRLQRDVFAVVTPAQAAEWARAGFELFVEKSAQGGRATAYDCRDFACRLPVTDPAELAA